MAILAVCGAIALLLILVVGPIVWYALAKKWQVLNAQKDLEKQEKTIDESVASIQKNISDWVDSHR